MRIVRAEVLEYVRKLDGRSWNPVSRWTERRAPLVVLESSDGLRAAGEAWSQPEEIRAVQDALAHLVREHVIGSRFDEEASIAVLHDRIAAARDNRIVSAAQSALDMALWGLLAKTRERPLWQLLGGVSGEVSVYASCGLYRDGCDAQDLSREVAGYRALGFRGIKIKVGGLPLERDLERIALARGAIGADGELWVDAVNQLPPNEAVRIADAYRNAGANALQAPVAFDDFVTMRSVNERAIPVVAGEAEFSDDAFSWLLQTRSLSLLQLNLGLCGGFTGAARVAKLAAGYSIPVTVQAHATAVLLSASLQWGAAARVHSVEYHCFHDHLRSLMPPLEMVDGMARLGSGDALPHAGKSKDGDEELRSSAVIDFRDEA